MSRTLLALGTLGLGVLVLVLGRDGEPRDTPPAGPTPATSTPVAGSSAAELPSMELPPGPGAREPELAPLAPTDPPHASITEPYPWTEAERVQAVQEQLRLDAQGRALVLRGYAPEVAGKTRAEVRAHLGVEELTEAWHAELLALEQPHNADIDALANLHADDLDAALRAVWDEGLYHVELHQDPAAKRDPMVGESSVVFPDRTYFYRLEQDRFPHLAETREALAELERARMGALRMKLWDLRHGQ